MVMKHLSIGFPFQRWMEPNDNSGGWASSTSESFFQWMGTMLKMVHFGHFENLGGFFY
jgi:hypothetical protein